MLSISLISRSRLIALLIIAFVLPGAFAVLARSWRQPSPMTPSGEPASPATVMVPSGPIQSVRTQFALITIRPTGFDPSEIRLGVGRFTLAVDNKSGLDGV